MTLHEAEQHLSLALEAAVRSSGHGPAGGAAIPARDEGLDEVMQEVRIRLWRARGTSEQIDETNTSYVYRTASTAALDVLRRRRARQSERHDSIDGDDAVAMLTAPNPDPHAALEGTELANRVARAIDEIPATRRPAVRMHLAGYPREEIAKLMGWTEAKTRNLLYRGLADLRERLVRGRYRMGHGGRDHVNDQELRCHLRQRHDVQRPRAVIRPAPSPKRSSPSSGARVRRRRVSPRSTTS